MVVCLVLAASPAWADKVQLHVAAFATYDEAIKYAKPLFEAEYPDIEIKLVALAFGDHHNAMTTALSTGANIPDVMALEVDYVGKFTNSGGLVNLAMAPFHAEEYVDQFAAFTIPLATGADGALAGLPVDIGPGALYYHSDVLKAAEVDASLLNRDWESFIEAGKKIKETTGSYLVAGAGDVKNVLIRVGLNEGEGIYFDQDNNVLVENERFQNAFRYAKQIREAGLDANVGTWTSEWTEGLRRGDIATQISGSWLGGAFKDWIAPEQNVWRTAQLPAQAYASFGGTFVAIPRKAEHKPEAWEFVKFMATNVEVQEQVFENLDIFPSLVAAHDSDYMSQPLDYLGGQKARLEWKHAAENIPDIIVNKHDPIAAQIVNDALESVLEQNVEIEVALADAARLIKRRARR